MGKAKRKQRKTKQSKALLLLFFCSRSLCIFSSNCCCPPLLHDPRCYSSHLKFRKGAIGDGTGEGFALASLQHKATKTILEIFDFLLCSFSQIFKLLRSTEQPKSNTF
ncbi:hypothetical protein Q3G72_034945 [Acer saccharum]|nr:hypothetical protein Q3G72_034945 [Acer saccharum]